MGSGKTTLGRVLAKTLQLSFVDLDWYIENRFHKTVGELFSERGESGFREIESRMLHEAGMMNDSVIATGGGAPCFNDNLGFMLDNGLVVYLKASVDVLFDRLKLARKQRPLLRDKNDEELRAFITDTLASRAPLYEQAHLTFDADNLDSVADIDIAARKLKELIEKSL